MIIIVGAGGFLGFSFSKYFSQRGVDFITLSRSFQWPQMQFEKRFIGSASDAEHLINFLPSDLQVLYMAGSSNLVLAQQDPVGDFETHYSEINSFLNFLDGVGCKCFIFFSSGGTVYGDSLGFAKFEEAELSPKSVYGKRNVALERFVRTRLDSSRILTSVFRVTNPFGPGQYRFRRRGLIQALIDSSSSGHLVPIRGDGYQKRDYIYSEDLCWSVAKLLELDNLPSTINIASGFSYSARQVLSVLNENDIFPSFEYLDESEPFEVRDSLVSSSLLCSLLGVDSDRLRPFKKENFVDMLLLEGI